MNSTKIQKNKTNENNNPNNINQEKIVINSITDLLKIPIHKLNNSNLENLSGEYFDKIYQEAINSESQLEVEENSPNSLNKSKKKSHKEQRNKSNNNSINKPKKKKKSRTNINESNANKNNNNIIEKNDFYVEEGEAELGLPERGNKRYKYLEDSKKNIKKQIIKENKKMKLKQKQINNNNNVKINNEEENNHINNITPFENEAREAYIYGTGETPGNEEENEENNYYMKNDYYTPTPTPMPNDEEDEDKKEEEIVIYPLSKMIFSIVYNSFYGEEVCILGSSPKLGNWKLSGALHLKWHSGNLWKGEIKIEVEDLQDFEFKFVIVEKGEIKHWESGNNNIINFTGLINEFQFRKKGRYNKYEYEYNPNDGTVSIKCNWRR